LERLTGLAGTGLAACILLSEQSQEDCLVARLDALTVNLDKDTTDSFRAAADTGPTLHP
jgi:hypothetical protein